jgi:hypothetical protein
MKQNRLTVQELLRYALRHSLLKHFKARILLSAVSSGLSTMQLLHLIKTHRAKLLLGDPHLTIKIIYVKPRISYPLWT